MKVNELLLLEAVIPVLMLSGRLFALILRREAAWWAGPIRLFRAADSARSDPLTRAVSNGLVGLLCAFLLLPMGIAVYVAFVAYLEGRPLVSVAYAGFVIGIPLVWMFVTAGIGKLRQRGSASPPGRAQ